MCGISGIVSDDSNSYLIVEEMNNRIRHRGPDGQRVWRGKGVTLGHCRLSILDLSEAGDQPMPYEEDRYWIVFNGEIYNFLEIRKQLELKGVRFKSNTDTEVILSAYVEWGADCFQKFNGMWALAIWDTNTNSLFLSRDRFGIKPLYYHIDHNMFAFSSEMKGLFPLLREITPNYPIVEQAKINSFRYEATEECLVEGIKRFPAGHHGYYKDGHLNLVQWWDTLENLPKVPIKYDDQVEIFRDLFLDACLIRMRSDVPIGTCLSGGLDSSAVTCSMKHIASQANERQADDWQNAFIAAFPGTPLDETRYAKQVIDHTGVKAHYINVNPLDDIDNLDEILYLYEEISVTSPIPFMQTYKKVKKMGVTVTLDGHGADEVFGGYEFSIPHACLDIGFDPNRINKLFQIYKDCQGDMGLQSNSHFKMARQFFEVPLRESAKILFGKNRFENDLISKSAKAEELSHFNRYLYLLTHLTVLPTILRNYDRYSMANSVEIRMPFMDWRIITFAFAIDTSSKIGEGFTKRIIRDAIAPFMPASIAYRKTKLGFNSPVVDWLRGPMREWLLDQSRDQLFLQSSLIDGKQLASEINQFLRSEQVEFHQGVRLWAKIAPYLWEKAVIHSSSSFKIRNSLGMY